MRLYKEFNNLCRENPRKEAGVIREWYEKYFDGEFPPWDKHPYELVKLKLSYELLKIDYEKANIPIPLSVQQNYKASRDFNIEGLTKGLRHLVEITIKHNDQTLQSETSNDDQKPVGKLTKKDGGKEKMAKKVETKKAPRVTVAQTIMSVLSENETKHYSDAKLAELINKAHPDKKQNTEKDIKTYRTKYNSGRNWGMNKPPKPLSQCYDKPVKKAKPVVEAKKKIVLKRKK